MMPYTPNAALGEVLAEDGDLQTFNQLLRRSGVIEKIDGPGPFTVFAPTDAAFELIPHSEMGQLVEHPQRLEQVVSYHIVRGGYRGGSIREFDHLPTLHGDPVTVLVAEEGVLVGGAGLEETDIPASNGLIHKISNVMFPPD